MTEMDEREVEMDGKMDHLLRRSLSAPIPNLPPDFDRRVTSKIREAKQGLQPLDRYRRILFAGYGVASILTSAVVMRGQGLGWDATTGLILAPLALVAAARWAPRDWAWKTWTGR